MGVGRIVDEAIKLPGSLLRNSLIIGPFLLVGFALIALRYIFMEFCPWGARHAKLTTNFINFTLDIIWIIFEAAKVCIDVVIEIINAIPGVKGGKPLPLKGQPAHVSAEDVREFLHRIPIQCHDYTWTNAELLLFPIRKLMNPLVCPVIRFFYPIDWAYAGMEAVMGWMSEDPTPIAGGGNCNPGPDVYWICVGFGSGYLVLELFMPLLVFFLIAAPLLFALIGEAFTLVRLSLRISIDVEKFVARILGRLGTLVEDIVDVN